MAPYPLGLQTWPNGIIFAHQGFCVYMYEYMYEYQSVPEAIHNPVAFKVWVLTVDN